VNLEFSQEALAYGRAASHAFATAGGDELVRSIEEQPHRREATLGPLFLGLGAWEINPRAGSDDLEAAAALCIESGYWCLPYPVSERLSRPLDLDVDALLVISETHPAGIFEYLDLRMATVNFDGVRSLAKSQPTMKKVRYSAFVTNLDLVAIDERGLSDLALALVLSSCTLLGMMNRAVELTSHYVRERQQFGKPLATFQGVQFQLTDAEIERAGIEQLVKHSLWNLETERDESLEDALALRLATLESAAMVFRVAHQLHGAIGFCDEATLSWLSRYSQPLRRLPVGVSGTKKQFVRLMENRFERELASEVGI
jgi:hypothetical protein